MPRLGMPSVVPSTPSAMDGRTQDLPTQASPSLLGRWVDEITGRGRASGVRVPTADEISRLTIMFPNDSRELIVATLQRRYEFIVGLSLAQCAQYATKRHPWPLYSENLGQAVEIMLTTGATSNEES
jgi:hypothetical protein